MRTTEALADLQRLNEPIIETNEAAVRLGISTSRASQLLGTLEESGLVQRVRRGLWSLHRGIDPFVVPPYLTSPFPAYVSFWSALARHGMIDQVPRQIFVASIDRTRRIVTRVAVYSIHHLVPELFDGYVGSERTGYIASPEKALFDTVYLLAARSGRLYLPELELPDRFDRGRVRAWTKRVTSPRLRTLVSRGLAQVLGPAGRPRAE